MSAIDTALQRIARETKIVVERCHELAVQRLMNSAWLYRETASSVLGIGFKEAWDMDHADIRKRALARAATERARINHWSFDLSRYRACLELAEAAKRRFEREQKRGA